MAQMIARSEADRRGISQIAFGSAGLEARAGPASQHALMVATERASALSGHRSRPFDSSAARWADLVLTMTEHQAISARRQIPAERHKVHVFARFCALARDREQTETIAGWLGSHVSIAADSAHQLGESADSADPSDAASFDIADPYGLPIEVYRHLADRLDRLVGSLFDLVGRSE